MNEILLRCSLCKFAAVYQRGYPKSLWKIVDRGSVTSTVAVPCPNCNSNLDTLLGEFAMPHSIDYAEKKEAAK